MRVALVRGRNLNPWELANFDLEAEVVAIGTRRGAFEADLRPLQEVRRLASPADVLGALPVLVQGLVRRATGSPERLVGLERALRGFDLAHVAELSNPYSLQAIRARDRGACRRVVATVWENIALPTPENSLVARRVAETAASLDRCLAVTRRAALHLRLAGVPDDRIDVIPMGVELDHFSPGLARPPDDALRVLSVSRLVAEKGVADLLVALRLLAERGLEVRLTFAGQGPLQQHLKRMADDLGVARSVHFAGHVSHADMPSCHRAHDVFVLASAPRTTWQEQFGFAVVEAMASGLPVVAGDSGSLDEVVGDERQLVTPAHPVALADAIERLARDASLRAELGARNRRRAEERYDCRAIAQRIRLFYEHALGDAPRATTSSRTLARELATASQS